MTYMFALPLGLQSAVLCKFRACPKGYTRQDETKPKHLQRDNENENERTQALCHLLQYCFSMLRSCVKQPSA